MKVSTLITLLQLVPQDYEVTVRTPSNGHKPIKSVAYNNYHKQVAFSSKDHPQLIDEMLRVGATEEDMKAITILEG